jgi:acyl carrier protein
MERAHVWQVVHQRAVELLDLDPAAVAEEVTFDSLGVDSLSLVEYTLRLEDAFDVELPEEEVLAETTFAGLVDVVLGQLDVSPLDQ